MPERTPCGASIYFTLLELVLLREAVYFGTPYCYG